MISHQIFPYHNTLFSSHLPLHPRRHLRFTHPYNVKHFVLKVYPTLLKISSTLQSPHHIIKSLFHMPPMSSSCEKPSSEAPSSAILSSPAGSQASPSDEHSLVTMGRDTPWSPVESLHEYLDSESTGCSSSRPSADSLIFRSVEQGEMVAPEPRETSLSDNLFMRLMRPAAQLMISPADPTLIPTEQALKYREELFSHVPHAVQKTMHSVRTTRHALADPTGTPSSPPNWVKNVDSKFISEKWPQIVEHHKTIMAAAVKQFRLKELERELQTPEARSVLLKIKERGELKKDICLSHTDIADQIFAEEDPAMWAMLLELYQQEVGENLLEPHSPPDPPGFAAVIDDLLYDPTKDSSYGSKHS
ncbi:hypothetical protein PMG11_03682 [Penicillium brasilianum]|uniref:Uncharacterized protein n=1 Tax=Penicillium brasilianum TaxID=104259 RepID=A0A0F7VE52_PENBI|nr:hypothetical protein PMG11_03682 [Penicillium brasilianum]